MPESKRVFVTAETINNQFTYHAPVFDQGERYDKLRAKAKELAMLMLELCPESPELSTAISHLRTASFWANAAIACNPPEES